MCKQCQRLEYQFRAHRYFRDLPEGEKLTIIEAIHKYWAVNNVAHFWNGNELDFWYFLMENEGDATIIQVITGFTGY